MALQRTYFSQLKRRQDIDGLRAVAVLAVVAFHAFPGWVRGGFTGVDVFFVISGYLISRIIFNSLDRGTFNFFVFYARRIRRIFPALIFVLAASFILGWFILLPDEFKQLGKHMIAAAVGASNFVLLNEAGYFDVSSETKPLLHLWSLGIEWQFYVIWPLFLWCLWKGGVNFLAITVVVISASFILGVVSVDQAAAGAFYSPQTRLWELLCGGLLAWCELYKAGAYAGAISRVERFFTPLSRREVNGDSLSTVFSLFGLLLLAYGFWRINQESGFPGKWAVIPVLGALLIIAAGPKAWLNRTVLSGRIFLWFGAISFPLYLWHWPLLSFARIVEGQALSLSVRIGIVFISVALAWFTYRLVEGPVRFHKNRKWKTATLVSLMTVVGSAGYIAYDKNGLSFRFPKIIQEVIGYQYDFRSVYDFQSVYRDGTCLFDGADQTLEEFKNCYVKDPNKLRTILLWGDSHAAHLYPGLKKRYEQDSNIVQFTASVCPPILDLDIKDRVDCRQINDFVFDEVRKAPVDIAVLSANWTYYDLSKLEETIVRLKEAGVKAIYIIGPVPQWNGGLPRQLVTHFNKSMPRVVPHRMSTGLRHNFIEIDGILRERIKLIGVHYISAKDILCNVDGCITRVGDTSDLIMAFDDAHLTAAGSEFLVSHFPAF